MTSLGEKTPYISIENGVSKFVDDLSPLRGTNSPPLNYDNTNNHLTANISPLLSKQAPNPMVHSRSSDYGEREQKRFISINIFPIDYLLLNKKIQGSLISKLQLDYWKHYSF